MLKIKKFYCHFSQYRVASTTIGCKKKNGFLNGDLEEGVRMDLLSRFDKEKEHARFAN